MCPNGLATQRHRCTKAVAGSNERVDRDRAWKQHGYGVIVMVILEILADELVNEDVFAAQLRFLSLLTPGNDWCMLDVACGRCAWCAARMSSLTKMVSVERWFLDLRTAQAAHPHRRRDP